MSWPCHWSLVLCAQNDKFWNKDFVYWFFLCAKGTIKCLLLFSRSVVSASLWPHGLQHARLPCLSLSPVVCSNSWTLSQWCHWVSDTISSTVSPFSSCLQSFPASGSFPMSRLFTTGGQVLEFSFSISPSNEYSVIGLAKKFLWAFR